MQARWETLMVDGDPMPVYIALPEHNRPSPIVIVMQGRGGVEEAIQDQTRRVAEAGFIAAAPAIYHRQKDSILDEVDHLPPGHPERRRKLKIKAEMLQDEEIISDALATIEYLRTLSQADTQNIGVIGFCQGGRSTYLLATSLEVFGAAVAFYPSHLWTAQGSGPAPIDRSPKLCCPLLGIFGGSDNDPSPADMQAIGARLSHLAKPHEFLVYEGAGHDFQNWRSADRYHESAAKDSWVRMTAFLNQHLKAQVDPPNS